MPESTCIRTLRDGQIIITDSGAAHSYTVAYEPGDFSYSVPLNDTLNFLDRNEIGTTPSIRKGPDQPMTFSFSAYLRDLGSPLYATLADICHRYAAGYVASNWVSTLTCSDEMVLTVALTIDGTAFGESDKTVTFNYCVLRADIAEGDPNTISVSGTSFQVRPIFA